MNERTLRWAFMPPYLNTLNFSEHELRNRTGWTLTQAALLEMQRATHDFGGEFVVMFLPFKSQVYWPALERVPMVGMSSRGIPNRTHSDDGPVVRRERATRIILKHCSK